MKRVLLVFSFVVTATLLRAQKIYFVYLQTETSEPFFVRMDNKLYSSSESGYLILPRLKDSTYTFKLGFPGKSFDLDFSTSINKRDHGYLIKNFGEKGWGLFDLQNLSIQMSSSNARSTSELKNSSNVPVNAFTDMLSKAADDPTLKQTPFVVRQEEKKPEPMQTVQKEEKKPEATDAVVKEEKKPGAVVPQQGNSNEQRMETANANQQKIDTTWKAGERKPVDVYKKSQVTKVSGIATPEGFESVFLDEYQNGNRDTIRILIPANGNDAIIKEAPKPDSTKEDKKFLDVAPDTAKAVHKAEPDAKKDGSKKWWPFTKNKDAEVSKPRSEENKDHAPKWSLFKNNRDKVVANAKRSCQSIAGKDDFLKLRRKMAARTNDDGMLDEAKRYFKEKCFNTEQLKNLSTMFLSNAGKYNFFDIAHNYVSDKENFSSLQSELKDQYYINRFKSLLGN